jgi:hypothetical protein
MSSHGFFIKRLVLTVVGLLVTLSAIAAPFVDALQLPSAMNEHAPQPAPLLLCAFALLAISALLRTRGGR